MRRRIFSLDDARRLLPQVKKLTFEAVSRTHQLDTTLADLADDDPERERLVAELNEVVSRWARRLAALQVEAKGLWLVDEERFAGRIRIVS